MNRRGYYVSSSKYRDKYFLFAVLFFRLENLKIREDIAEHSSQPKSMYIPMCM